MRGTGGGRREEERDGLGTERRNERSGRETEKKGQE